MNAFPRYRIGQRVTGPQGVGKIGYYYSDGRFGITWSSGHETWHKPEEWGTVIHPAAEESQAPPPTLR